MGVKGIWTPLTEPDMFIVKYLCLSVSSCGGIFSCFYHSMLRGLCGHMHISKNSVDSLKELALIVKSYCYRFKINGIYIGEIIELLEIRNLKEESRRIWNVGGSSPVSCRWQYYLMLIPLMNPI